MYTSVPKRQNISVAHEKIKQNKPRSRDRDKNLVQHFKANGKPDDNFNVNFKEWKNKKIHILMYV